MSENRAASAVSAVVVVAVVAIAALLVAPSLSPAWVAPAQSGTAEVTPSGEVTQVTVTVEGMAFSPSTIIVPAGNSLEVTLSNTGDQRHDLAFSNGAVLPAVAPGASASIDVGVIAENLEGWCTLPGHKQMGMVLEVIAEGAAGSVVSDHGTHAEQKTASDAPSMTELVETAQGLTPHPAELAPLSEETVHEFTFEVTEDEQQLAEGIVTPVWTYNGTSPGPTLHGRIGDTFIITLVNSGTMGHSIDFHAGDVAPNEPMRTIEPGESLVYEFTAKRAGIWMYHCSTMPMSRHIAQGMFGAVVIEPDDLAAADRSYVLVQSEHYLSEEALAGMNPDLMAFNGQPFQYDAHPLPARVGERVRVWVLDVGPNESLAFHVVGTQFDTVWTEGAYSVHRDQSTDGLTQGATGAQVLPLMAAQGGFVEFVPVEAGRYAFVNHIMSLAEKGAHGFFEVTD